MRDDPRFPQANREALYALAAYALYFLWWYATAYGLGDGDPAAYGYVWGFPAWFFWSCIAGYPLACLLVWGLTRVITHVTLEPQSAATPPPPDTRA